MSKIIKLTESQLKKIVMEMMDVSSDSPHYVQRRRKVEIGFDDLAMMGSISKRWCEDRMGLPDCQRVYEIYSNYGLMNESKNIDEFQVNKGTDFSAFSKYPCIKTTAMNNGWMRYDDNDDGKIERVQQQLGAGGYKTYFPNGSIKIYTNGKETKSTYGCKGNQVIDSFIQNPAGKVYADPKNPFVKSPNGTMVIPYFIKDGNGGLWITNLQKVLIRLKLLNLTKPTGFMGNMTKDAISAAAKKYNSYMETNLNNGIPKEFYNQLINLKPGQ
jgi:hypothetical protein